MKSAIVAVCLVACAFAASVDQDAQVVRSDYNQDPVGSFQYGYETSNGIAAQATGDVKPVGKDEVALNVAGNVQYTAPDGQVVQLTYTADENGFHPQGAHLPTPPPAEPIPDYIAKSLDWIAAHPYDEKKF